MKATVIAPYKLNRWDSAGWIWLVISLCIARPASKVSLG